MKAGLDYIGVGCGALIINDKNETLLIKRAVSSKNEAGCWSKPGGSVEFGETVEDAVIRECKEELGIDIKLLDFLCYTDHIIQSEEQHWVALNFLAKIVKGTPQNMEPEKIIELAWFNLESLPEKINQTTKESIDTYLNIK